MLMECNQCDVANGTTIFGSIDWREPYSQEQVDSRLLSLTTNTGASSTTSGSDTPEDLAIPGPTRANVESTCSLRRTQGDLAASGYRIPVAITETSTNRRERETLVH